MKQLIITLVIFFTALVNAQDQNLTEQFIFECVLKEDSNGLREDNFTMRFAINQKKQTIVHLTSVSNNSPRQILNKSQKILIWQFPGNLRYSYYSGNWRGEVTIDIQKGTYLGVQYRPNYDYKTYGKCSVPGKKRQSTKEGVWLNGSEEVIKVSSGTGFAINDSGNIITNSHVISGCKRVDVHYKGKIYPSVIIANDIFNDLALLETELRSNKYFAIKNIESNLLDDVYAAGYPFGDQYSSSVKVTRGIVSSLTGIGDNYSQIQIDAALQPGNSGGPIFDKKGALIGVAVSKLSLDEVMNRFGVVPENQNFAIKANLVRNLLSANSIDFKDQINASTTLLNNIEDATYYLSCWMQRNKIKEYSENKVMFKSLKGN